MSKHLIGLPVTRTRAPFRFDRMTLLLLCACLYASGFFTGAILYGELLLTLHR